MKTIEQFKTEIGDHYAMIDLDLVDSGVFKTALTYHAAKVVVGDKTFARVGFLRAGGTGTLVTEEEFRTYFDDYGQVMLDEAEWAAYVAENTVVEEEEI